MTSISAQQLYELHQRGVPLHLLDVRTPAEYHATHVSFAENCPLESLDCAAIARSSREHPEARLFVICQKGSRGVTACRQLANAGLSEATNVEGGTSAWQAAGLPVIRGKKAVSLERQVRIAAGLLVLVGCALAVFVHPY
jgi:rhodanese-related sulfurtransferase